MLPFFPVPLAVGNDPLVSATIAKPALPQIAINGTSVPKVPFYSQFSDISAPSWRGKGCGITSLAMVISYFKQSPVSVNSLLSEGISDGAYISSAGWSYNGLIQVAKAHGLTGSAYDLSGSSQSAALAQLKASLANGPVIVSVHYKFDPASTIPHLVVIDSIQGNTVYYNDPAAKSGEKQISVDAFLKGWKKRFIVIRPQAVEGVA